MGLKLQPVRMTTGQAQHWLGVPICVQPMQSGKRNAPHSPAEGRGRTQTGELWESAERIRGGENAPRIGPSMTLLYAGVCRSIMTGYRTADARCCREKKEARASHHHHQHHHTPPSTKVCAERYPAERSAASLVCAVAPFCSNLLQSPRGSNDQAVFHGCASDCIESGCW